MSDHDIPLQDAHIDEAEEDPAEEPSADDGLDALRKRLQVSNWVQLILCLIFHTS